MDEAREANRRALLGKIRAYMQQHGITKSEFGALAVNSPSLVFNLERGSWVRPGTLTRISNTLAYPPPERRQAPRFTAQARQARAKVEDNIRVASEAARYRATDEIEQVKRHLRSRGFNVFAATVYDPKDVTGIYVSNKRLTAVELVEMAERHGFTIRPQFIPPSSSGRTTAFEAGDVGSSPAGGTTR